MLKDTSHYMTFEQVLADHPELEREDILASLSYATKIGTLITPILRNADGNGFEISGYRPTIFL